MARTDAARRAATLEEVELVLVTAPNLDVGRSLARELVDSRLAACVNVVPGLCSIYRYQGSVHEDAEVLLLVKTCASRADDLDAFLGARHPYDLPELVRIPVPGGSLAYLDWVREGCAP
jgi:periplasmic divalent cation tolerance protein